MNNIIDAEYREVTALEEYSTDRLAAEANNLYHQAEGMANASLMMLAEAGRRLTVIKEREGHGNWERWMDMNLSFSARKANRIIKLAENLSQKNGVFANPTTLSDVGISKVWVLLEAPEEVQKEVMENPEMEDATVKEFKEEIKRLKEENEKLGPLKEEIETLTEKLSSQQEEIEDLKIEKESAVDDEKIKALEEEIARKERVYAEAENEISAQKHKLEEAQQALQDERQNKAAELADVRTKSYAEGREAAEKDITAIKQKSEEKIRQLEDELSRQKKAGNPKLAVFKSKYEDIQNDVAGILVFISEFEEAEQQKLKAALKQGLKKIEEQI